MQLSEVKFVIDRCRIQPAQADKKSNAESRDRTGELQIFSLALSQLSDHGLIVLLQGHTSSARTASVPARHTPNPHPRFTPPFTRAWAAGRLPERAHACGVPPHCGARLRGRRAAWHGVHARSCGRAHPPAARPHPATPPLAGGGVRTGDAPTTPSGACTRCGTALPRRRRVCGGAMPCQRCASVARWQRNVLCVPCT